jgi:putative flippase GtrA
MTVYTQFLSFVVVGLSNSAVDLGVFNLLYAIQPTANVDWLVAYNSIAVVCAIANSYVWNTRWTFRRQALHHGGGAWRQRILFVAQSLLNIAINDLIVLFIAPYLMAIHGLPPRLASNAAKAVAMVIASLISFVAMRLVVFASR